MYRTVNNGIEYGPCDVVYNLNYIYNITNILNVDTIYVKYKRIDMILKYIPKNIKKIYFECTGNSEFNRITIDCKSHLNYLYIIDNNLSVKIITLYVNTLIIKKRGYYNYVDVTFDKFPNRIEYLDIYSATLVTCPKKLPRTLLTAYIQTFHSILKINKRLQSLTISSGTTFIGSFRNIKTISTLSESINKKTINIKCNIDSEYIKLCVVIYYLNYI